MYASTGPDKCCKVFTECSVSRKLTNKKKKIFSENKKGLGMAYHTPPLNKVKQGEMPFISQPQYHPIPKFYIFLMEWSLIGHP